MKMMLIKFVVAATLAVEATCSYATTQAFCSSSDRKYNLSPCDVPVSGPGKPAANASTWKLSIDDTDAGKKQTIVGFGGAITDATVYSYNKLSSALKAKLLRDLLTTDGADFSLFRHTIGASDLSGPPAYTYDDNGGGNKSDPKLASFGLGDCGNAMAGMIKDMRAVKSELKLLGSVWAPPGWMQLDGVLSGTTLNNNLNHNYVSAYAQYFVKYLQAFASKGATVDAITIQNEPLNSQSGYPTMYIFANESGELIANNVGPALKAAGLPTEVWAYDHNTDHPEYPEAVLAHAAPKYVNSVAWHCYAPNNSWSVLTDFHAKHPGVAQYMTECWTSSTETPWNQASGFTVGPLQNWAAGSIAWTLGTNNQDGPHLDTGGCTTCRGLFTVDDTAAAPSYTFQVDYYMMAQYSKFMPRGSVVMSGTGSFTYAGGGGVESVAARTPQGGRVVVIQNTFGNDIYVTLTTGSGQTWSGNVYKSSVVTWLLP